MNIVNHDGHHQHRPRRRRPFRVRGMASEADAVFSARAGDTIVVRSETEAASVRNGLAVRGTEGVTVEVKA